MTTTKKEQAATVKRSDIRALRAEAAVAGDLAMVAICDRAEEGEADAIRRVAEAIAAARAMQ